MPTNPICSKCNHPFFTTRESQVPSAFGMAPSAPRPPPLTPQAAAPAPEAFDPFDLPPAPAGRPPPATTSATPPATPSALPPGPSPGLRPPPPVPAPPPKPAKRPRRSSFPRVPKNVPEEGLEPLRYDAMKKALLCVALLIVVSVVVPLVQGALHLTVAFIGVVGVIDYAIVFVFFLYFRGVAKLTKKPISPTEVQALGRVKGGGALLLAVPLLGSVTGQAGIYFQTNPMHPIYYAIAGAGIFYTLSGVTSLKERYSYFSVFEFGFLLLLLQPLPALLPGDLGNRVFVNAYWFSTTFLALSVGFIAIAMALRKMRAGQYDALEQEVAEGQKALEARQFDKALPHFDRAVTIAHSLYSDKLFKTTRTGQRVLPSDYYLPWVGKATALALSGRGGKALTILDIILEVDGTNADLWLNKGEVLLALGRPAEAYISFEAAQRLNPALARAGDLKGRALDLLRRRVE